MPPLPKDPFDNIPITQEDLDAVKPTLEALDVSWWKKDHYLKVLARVYAAGKQVREKEAVNGC